MKYFTLFFIFFTVISCKEDKYSGIHFQAPEFRDSVFVKANVLNDTIFTKFAWGMASYKDYIILLATLENDCMLHIYDKKNGKKVRSFAELGRGPEQITELRNFCVSEPENILISFAQGEKSILIFHLDSILNNNNPILEKIPIKKFDQATFSNVYKCKTGYLLQGGKCEVYPEGARFMIINENEKLLSLFDRYPIHSGSDSVNTGFDWLGLQPVATISPDGTRFAEATRLGGILEIIDLKNQIKSKIIKGYFKPYFYQENNKTTFTPKTKFGFYYISSSDNYLYALSFNGNNTDKYASCDMQVFDWEGNPIKKYKTNYQLLNVCPDEKAEKVYALAFTPTQELVLLYFDL